jgi:hypothetical protein
MAPSGPGPYATGLRTGRWPLSGLAGMRARTLAALADAASKPSLPRPHAELAISREASSPGDCGSLTPCAALVRFAFGRLASPGDCGSLTPCAHHKLTDLQWRQARRAGGQKRLDGTYVAASSAARMPGNVRVHHGRARRVQRWTFPEGRYWRKPAEAERPLSRMVALQLFLARNRSPSVPKRPEPPTVRA